MSQLECAKLITLVKSACLLHDCETNAAGFGKLSQIAESDFDKQDKLLKYLQNLFSDSKTNLAKGISKIGRREKNLLPVLKLAGFASYNDFLNAWDRNAHYIRDDAQIISAAASSVCLTINASVRKHLEKLLHSFERHLDFEVTLKDIEADSDAIVKDLLTQHQFLVWASPTIGAEDEKAEKFAITKRIIPVWISSDQITLASEVDPPAFKHRIAGLNGLVLALLFLAEVSENVKRDDAKNETTKIGTPKNYIGHVENSGTFIMGDTTNYSADTVNVGYHYGNSSSKNNGENDANSQNS